MSSGFRATHTHSRSTLPLLHHHCHSQGLRNVCSAFCLNAMTCDLWPAACWWGVMLLMWSSEFSFLMRESQKSLECKKSLAFVQVSLFNLKCNLKLILDGYFFVFTACTCSTQQHRYPTFMSLPIHSYKHHTHGSGSAQQCQPRSLSLWQTGENVCQSELSSMLKRCICDQMVVMWSVGLRDDWCHLGFLSASCVTAR